MTRGDIFATRLVAPLSPPLCPLRLMPHRHALHRSLRTVLVSLCMASATATSALAQGVAKSGTVPHDDARERALLSPVKVPDGFTATLFAAPPIAMYPVCLTDRKSVV